jgi:outer membrane murein-binding lipoprotein Lpp
MTSITGVPNAPTTGTGAVLTLAVRNATVRSAEDLIPSPRDPLSPRVVRQMDWRTDQFRTTPSRPTAASPWRVRRMTTAPVTFDQVKGLFDAFDQKLTVRFESIDRRFEAIERRFEAIERRLDGHDQKLDALSSQFQILSGKFDSNHALFHSMANSVSDLHVKVDRLETKLNAVDAKVDDLDQEMKLYRVLARGQAGDIIALKEDVRRLTANAA